MAKVERKDVDKSKLKDVSVVWVMGERSGRRLVHKSMLAYLCTKCMTLPYPCTVFRRPRLRQGDPVRERAGEVRLHPPVHGRPHQGGGHGRIEQGRTAIQIGEKVASQYYCCGYVRTSCQ